MKENDINIIPFTNIKSIHLIGNTDPDKESAIKNSKMFTNRLVEFHEGGHRFPKIDKV